MLDELYDMLTERKRTRPRGSYTAHLLDEGDERILGKVLEEAEEVIRAAESETDARVVEEMADLLYHLMVLLVARDIPLDAVWAELESRR